MTARTCKVCLELQPLEHFQVANSYRGKVYRRHECDGCRATRQAKLYRSQASARLEKARDYYARNMETVRGRRARYVQRNYGKVAALWVKRRLRQADATPSWLSPAQRAEIEAVYEHARDCRLITGEPYHVDHIIPLMGDGVCGLHVPWNLQVLPADVNQRKSARYDT